jgi:heme-degrading monooxygenase HmoA
MPTTEMVLPTVLESTYIVVWEFQVKAGYEAEFVAAYGSDGEWARLFRRSPDFLGVELLGSVGNPGRFFTLDHWRSATAMDMFMSANATAYDVLDHRFTSLTVWERRIGGFPTDA